MSPTHWWRCLSCISCSLKSWPISCECSSKFSCFSTFITANTAAHATGFPPYCNTRKLHHRIWVTWRFPLARNFLLWRDQKWNKRWIKKTILSLSIYIQRRSIMKNQDIRSGSRSLRAKHCSITQCAVFSCFITPAPIFCVRCRIFFARSGCRVFYCKLFSPFSLETQKKNVLHKAIKELATQRWIAN